MATRRAAGGRRTTARAAKAASRVLKRASSSRDAKTAAGSALSQRAPKGKGKR